MLTSWFGILQESRRILKTKNGDIIACRPEAPSKTPGLSTGTSLVCPLFVPA
jgi:hypothetical protein